MSYLWQGLTSIALLAGATGIETPLPTDDRLVVELVVSEPDVVTPTGIAVDEHGRLWVVENHTHFRPEDYEGPAGDRILIFDSFDARGRARRVRTFAEGFRDAMNIGLMPDGDVYLVTRARIYLLRDVDGDDKADEQRVVVDLKTTGDYPHNGLSGFALGPDGNVYFSLGENLGASYALVGSDGTTLGGGGEGGNIYRCRPDGSELEKVATGFWNTFDLGFDAFGRLFAVDNDPDSRPPCRLLHIVEGGDYGYRFRNGRKGLHPFTSWNGELPGTLPMVAGTGEAPSGIVAYESDGLPEEYRGDLLVTSWGDHVIQRFRLRSRGASFSATARTMVAGGESFRPVAIATGPDGSLYVTDWADRSYPLHRKGRIWRIRSAPTRDTHTPPRVVLSKVPSLRDDALAGLLSHPRQEVRFSAARTLAQRGSEGFGRLIATLQDDPDPRARVHALWAGRFRSPEEAAKLVQLALTDPQPKLRAAAVERFARQPESETASKLLGLALSDPSPLVRHRALLGLRGSKHLLEKVLPYLADEGPFLAAAAIEVLGRSGRTEWLLSRAGVDDVRMRLGVLLALRRTGTDEAQRALPGFLEDPDPAVRRAAIQWVAEEKLDALGPLVRSAVAKAPVTRELFEAYLAASDLLADGARAADYERDRNTHLADLLKEPDQPPSLRALALRALPTDHPQLSVVFLAALVADEDPSLRYEAVRTLATRGDEPSQQLLRLLATDLEVPRRVRAEAVMGLSYSAATSPATRRLLVALLATNALQAEALRALRGTTGDAEVRQAMLDLWETTKRRHEGKQDPLREVAAQLALCFAEDATSGGDSLTREVREAAEMPSFDPTQDLAVLAAEGDAEEGERIFFHPRGPKCFTCHRVNGRGGEAGPDLSTIARSLDRAKLIDSIVEPAKQIAPQFVTWTIAMRDGRVLSGVILRDGSEEITLADAEGKLTILSKQQIEERRPQNTSIMPDDLHRQMTPGEFRDLLAFLGTLQ